MGAVSCGGERITRRHGRVTIPAIGRGLLFHRQQAAITESGSRLHAIQGAAHAATPNPGPYSIH